MLSKGPAKRVTIFVNDDTRHGMEPLWRAVFDFLVHKQVSGATVTRPLMGFGSHHRVHSPDSETTMEHLPVRIEFIDSLERVQELLPTLYDLVNDGLIEVQDTTVLKVAQKEKTSGIKTQHIRKTATARLMRVFLGEADKWRGEPLYDAIVKDLPDGGRCGGHRVQGDSRLRRQRSNAQRAKLLSPCQGQSRHDFGNRLCRQYRSCGGDR